MEIVYNKNLFRKKTIPTCNNDFMPALISVFMKCFEQILKSRLLSFLNLDECQFAYKKDRSTKDACISLDYFLRCHLEQTSSFARVLFMGFTSAFSASVPRILIDKLKSVSVPCYFFICEKRVSCWLPAVLNACDRDLTSSKLNLIYLYALYDKNPVHQGFLFLLLCASSINGTISQKN